MHIIALRKNKNKRLFVQILSFFILSNQNILQHAGFKAYRNEKIIKL